MITNLLTKYEMSDIDFFKKKLAWAESRNDRPYVEKLKIMLALVEKRREINLLKIEYDALEAKLNLLYS